MIGEALAVGAALSWACAVILFKRSAEISPSGLNLFKNVVASLLLIATLAVIGVGIDWSRSTEDWLRLVVSGVIGISIADTLFFMALRRIGPSLLAVVETTYSPFSVLLAVLLLGERVDGWVLVGAGLVLLGLLTVTSESRLPDHLLTTSPRDRVVGVGLGLVAVFTLALAIVVAKPALERGNLIELSLIRLLAGTVVQLAWILPTRRGREALAVFRPSPVWRTLLPASVLGSYIAMVCWIGGFKWATVSVASVLNQLATVFIILLARVFLHEPLSGRRALGAGLALSGAVVIITAANAAAP